MPYKTEWVMPELFMEYRGVKVFYCYIENDICQPPSNYRFTLNPLCSGIECCTAEECNPHIPDKCRNVFDVTTLPEWKISGIGTTNEEFRKQVTIAKAIDSGYWPWLKLVEPTKVLIREDQAGFAMAQLADKREKMFQLRETEHEGLKLTIQATDPKEDHWLLFDKRTIEQLLPLLQHFVETGELADGPLEPLCPN